MQLPIIAYGHGELRHFCPDIDLKDPSLQQLIKDLWETMAAANGCGLAAPQVGRLHRLFVVDSTGTYENMDTEDRLNYFDNKDYGIRETFINARILERSAQVWTDEEGCLSIPGFTRSVNRPWSVKISYTDASFTPKEQIFGGMTARMIQHEYDHTDGILYIDHLPPLSRQLLESKLKQIARGKFSPKYPMR